MDIRRIEIAFDKELAAVIDAAVRNGDYVDLNELATEALTVWAHQRLLRDPRSVDGLRALIQEGLESGEPVEGNFDFEDIHRRGMERLERDKAA